MKVKKDLNRLIIAKIAEIFFVCAFILITIPLWQSINESVSKVDYSDTKLNFTSLAIENPIDYSMYPMSKTDALKRLSATKLIVENYSLTSENYVLTLKISKNSTLDYNCLNIAIDNKVMPLNTLDSWENDQNKYFVIASESLKGENKEYSIRLWIDEKTGNEMQNKELNLSFELEKSVTKI